MAKTYEVSKVASVRPSVRLFVGSVGRSIVRLFLRPSARSFVYLFVRPLGRSFIRSFDRSIVRSFHGLLIALMTFGRDRIKEEI